MHLLKGRWLAGHLVAGFFIVVFGLLGVWQLARNHQKQRETAASAAAYDAPAPDVIAVRDASAVPDTRIQAAGHYDPSHEVLWRNQLHGTETGTDVLTPLRLANGASVLVNRGWIPGIAEPPSPPTGTVTVRGLLHTSSALSAQDTVTEVNGRLALPKVDIARIQASFPYPLRTVWIEAQAQEPPPGSAGPQLPKPPPVDPVNHMEYAIEWFAFMAVPLIGWPIALRRFARKPVPPAPPAEESPTPVPL